MLMVRLEAAPAAAMGVEIKALRISYLLHRTHVIIVFCELQLRTKLVEK